MKRIFFSVIAASLLLAAVSPRLTALEIMKLSEVRAGMTGTGRTVFAGTETGTFDFKVLGFVEKFIPGKNLIIVELVSPLLDGSGVVAGMSGSPVYIDGKLVGAVAYGFNFSRKPIGGVTPIEDILSSVENRSPGYSVDISNIKMEFDPESTARIGTMIRDELVRRTTTSPIPEIVPIQLLGASRGIHPQALGPLQTMFAPASSLQVTRALDRTPPSDELFRIHPADAAAVPLIRGDFEYSASGTVTHVDGNKVYLFGHPFFNLGTVNFPLHKAEVVTLVSSYQNSFRLTASKNQIGTVIQDRISCLQAELGDGPAMIPMKVFLKRRNRSFNLEMIDHPLLTPALTAISLENIFISEYQQYGFNSIRVQGRVFIEGEKNIIIDDLFSGTSAFTEFSNLIMAIQYFVMNNPERRVKIQKLDFEISGSEVVRRSRLENVILDKNVYAPGETIRVKLHFRNERGNQVTEETSLRAPSLKPGSEFFVLVGDKNEIIRFDAKNNKSEYFPARLSHLVRAINNLRKNNRLYFKLMTSTSGLFVSGFEYSQLPPSMKSVFEYNTESDNQSQIRFSTLMEYQMELPAVIYGKKLFKLKIKER